ncbi:MAG: sigma-70 region 4 domain-containing protein [Oligoflexales bacterium]|nr:sigma-70 region 4 domain-containing protein [Oligoflexales bacterium]
MAKKSRVEASLDFYLEQLMPYAERLYPLFYSLTFDSSTAKKFLSEAYENFLDDSERLKKLPHLALFQELVSSSCKLITDKEKAASQKGEMPKGHFAFLPKVWEERLIWILADILGMSSKEIQEIEGKDEKSIRQILAQARIQVVNNPQFSSFFSQNLDLASHLPEFLNEDPSLPSPLKTKFENALAADANLQSTFELYKQKMGQVQFLFKEEGLQEVDLHELRKKARSDETSAAVEEMKIEVITNQESMKRLRHRMVGASFTLLGLAAIFYWVFIQKPPVRFDPIAPLAHEALILEEDDEGSLLDLPSSNWEEVVSYLQEQKDMDFTVSSLLALPQPWLLTGASTLDYEFTKIAVIHWTNQDGHQDLTQFIVPAEFVEKRSGEELKFSAEAGGLSYMTHATEQFNIISWFSEDALSVLVGRQSIERLAQLVESGQKKP